MIEKFGKSILTLFGIGYFKYAPGTAASIVTCALWLVLYSFKINFLLLVFLYLILLFYSIILIDKLSKKFSEVDAKEIVIDEFLGMSLALITFYSYLAIQQGWNNMDDLFLVTLLCFVLFRFFDIVKPFPINFIDKKLKNGLGVVMDDLIAGLFSLLIVWVVVFLFL
tara:strand:+ start:54 stop:554 length:501 start_codon:yes stop_codon:yes gene_type:complete